MSHKLLGEEYKRIIVCDADKSLHFCASRNVKEFLHKHALFPKFVSCFGTSPFTDIIYEVYDDGSMFNQDVTGPGNAKPEGAVSADDQILIQADVDPVDERAGMSVRIKKGTGVDDSVLHGTYLSASFYSALDGSENMLGKNVIVFDGNGRGQVDSEIDLNYTISTDGGLTIRTSDGLSDRIGQVASDGSIFVWGDVDHTDGFSGIEIGVRIYK